eukprot:GFUD01001533.1.p1 GENE.GFUD01001533.1~~GFUD01001533.1.p1  ORF type:complete len:169 (+),score=54.64 GFUD01001533.1:55-561(+)
MKEGVPDNKVVLVVAALLLLLVGVSDGAKGGVRAGVLNSRNSRRRNQGHRNYDTEWHGEDSGFGISQKRPRGDLPCDEVCQYSILLGLDEYDTPELETTPKPCIGLCQVKKRNNLKEDKNLTKIKAARKKGQRCVGLCYLRKKNGIKVDPQLEKLQNKGGHVWGFAIL